MVAKKVLVTGCMGQLGRDLMRLPGAKYDLVGCDLAQFDITDREAVCRKLGKIRPEIVLHAAAYTDVDGCESNKGTAMAVNAEASGHIAQACCEVGARMIYYSTDYVFDGSKSEPYTEEDEPRPVSVYGQSKYEGELRVADALEDYVILRLAWVYGFHGRNFVRTMLKLGWQQTRAQHRGEIITPLKVVEDQVGSPSWTVDIANQTGAVIGSDIRGVCHATAEGQVSWYGLATAVFEEVGMTIQVRPCTTEQFPRPAKRPANSVLENARLKASGLNRMRDWREGLHDFLHQQKEALLACNAT